MAKTIHFNSKFQLMAQRSIWFNSKWKTLFAQHWLLWTLCLMPTDKTSIYLVHHLYNFFGKSYCEIAVELIGIKVTFCCRRMYFNVHWLSWSHWWHLLSMATLLSAGSMMQTGCIPSMKNCSKCARKLALTGAILQWGSTLITSLLTIQPP